MYPDKNCCSSSIFNIFQQNFLFSFKSNRTTQNLLGKLSVYNQETCQKTAQNPHFWLFFISRAIKKLSDKLFSNNKMIHLFFFQTVFAIEAEKHFQRLHSLHFQIGCVFPHLNFIWMRFSQF